MRGRVVRRARREVAGRVAVLVVAERAVMPDNPVILSLAAHVMRVVPVILILEAFVQAHLCLEVVSRAAAKQMVLAMIAVIVHRVRVVCG